MELEKTYLCAECGDIKIKSKMEFINDDLEKRLEAEARSRMVFQKSAQDVSFLMICVSILCYH